MNTHLLIFLQSIMNTRFDKNTQMDLVRMTIFIFHVVRITIYIFDLVRITIWKTYCGMNTHLLIFFTIER